MMTVDLDLSPEAVERLAKRHALHVSSKYPTAATLRALSAELATARAENELMAKAIDEREIASGLSTNGGFWRWWAAQARDIAAKLDAAHGENARLRAERDAAWQAGAEAMREAAVICKRIRDKKCENDDQAIGALECTLAIQDALAAMDTPKGGGDE